MIITINIPPINVFNVGFSPIKYQTHNGPNAVSRRKKIPISGELIYCGAKLINTKEIPMVTIMIQKNTKSYAPTTNVLTRNIQRNAVINLPKIYDGTKFM